MSIEDDFYATLKLKSGEEIFWTKDMQPEVFILDLNRFGMKNCRIMNILINSILPMVIPLIMEFH